MLDVIHPEKESKLFSGRQYYLNLLKNNKEDAKKGIGKNILLAGAKSIGQSTILKEFMSQSKDIDCIFIDMEKISISPEKFSVEFIGTFLFWVSKGKIEDYSQFMDINYLEKLSLTSKSKEIIKQIKNELEKIKPDQNLVLQKAFLFPKTFAQENNKKTIICIKELQEIEGLNKFEQVSSIISLLEKNIAGTTVIATSSDPKFSSKLSEFSAEKVGYLDENETKELAGRITAKKINISELYEVSLGHPYHVRAICSSYEGDARKTFLQQLLGLDGKINARCRELLHYYLSKARGKSLLFILLKILSKNPLRLNEIARKLYRSSPVTKSLLSRLIDADLIHLKNGLFDFNDPILKKYVNLAIANNLEGASKEILSKLKI